MAFLQTTVASPTLARTVNVNLYFPTDLPDEIGNEVKGVITLLHGFTGNNTDWGLFTSAYRYAADNGYVLVMPSADNSFYNDLAFGGKYYTFINEELPLILGEIYNLPTEREKNFIAGLSMGGYGAMRIGLLNPERFAAIGCFSGAVDMRIMLLSAKIPGFSSDDTTKRIFRPVFGKSLRLPKNADLVHLARSAAKLPKAKQPRILITCGSEDNSSHMIKLQNDRFRKKVQNIDLNMEYREWSGTHEWTFWDRSLAEFIGFIQNSDYAKAKKQDWAHEITTQQKEPQL